VSFTKVSNRILAALLAIAISGALPAAQAWQQPATSPAGGETQAPATTPAPGAPASGTAAQPVAQPPAPQAQQGTPQTGTSVDPALGPLEPAPTDAAPEALPSAESSSGAAAQQQPASDQTVVDRLPDKPAPQKPAEPLGTATAQQGRTAGGAASKPAGTAIAPAKQRQVRSFLIKLGAIAGAGIAVGTVYMLTRKTPSNPPGALR